jgi:hypothetical protein
LSASNVSAAGATTLLVGVRNNAWRAGAFVVQVYVRKRVGRIARPNLLLANFTKVWLPAAGSAAAEVEVRAEELGYYAG